MPEIRAINLVRVQAELLLVNAEYSEHETQDLIGLVQARMVQEDCGILPMI